MKKLLLLSIFLLCTVLSLSACARNYNPYDLFEDLETFSITKSQHIQELDDMTLQESFGKLAIFRTQAYNYKVYDIEKNKVVKSFVHGNDISILHIYDMNYRLVNFISVYNTDGETELYQCNGEYIATTAGKVSNLTNNFGLFEFGDNIYKVNNDETVSLLGKSAFLPRISDFTDAANGYYYIENSYPTTIHVYNSNLVPTASWGKSDSDDSAGIFVLSNGNVLIQVKHKLPDDSKKYTYYSGNNKYNLSSYIMNPKNGKVKTVNLDYVIAKASYVGEWSGLDEKIKNIATIYPIKDKCILDGECSAKLVSLTNAGKISGYLFSNLKNFSPTDNIFQINNNVIVYESDTDEAYVANFDGEFIKCLGDFDSFFNNYIYGNTNQHHIVIDGVIYNWNFDSEYDLEKNGMTIEYTMPNCMILKDEERNMCYRYSDEGRLIKIGGISKITLEYGYYVVEKSTNTFDIYNDLGQKISTLNTAPTYVVGYQNSIIISVMEDGEKRYHLLKN